MAGNVGHGLSATFSGSVIKTVQEAESKIPGIVGTPVLWDSIRHISETRILKGVMQPKYDAGLHVCHHIGAEIAKRITQEA